MTIHISRDVSAMDREVRVSRKDRRPVAVISAGKKNPPCGGLKTLFSVGGALQCTVL
jgi:hypothetical protein